MNEVCNSNYSASSSDSSQIDEISCFREYEIVQSILLAEAKKTTDPQLKNRLKILALNAFSKSATISKSTAKRLGLQISPFFAGGMIYHRSGKSRMLRRLDRSYARALKLKPSEVTLVHSPLIREVLERNIGPIVKPQNMKDVQNRPLIVDVTGCTVDPKWLKEEQLYLIRFLEHRGQTVLHMPGAKDEFRGAIESIKQSHGFRLGPIEAKEAWLKVESIEKIASRSHVKITTAPPPKLHGPKCKEMREFLSHPIVIAFGKMDGVLPAATLALLKGFVKVDLPKSAVVDHAYQRMLEAMKSYKDPVSSATEMEVIHQEIQNLLGLAQPYKPGDLERAIAARVPTDLPVIGFAKPSAMNALASVVSAVEKQKGGAIEVVMQEEVYYESEYLFDDYTELSKVSSSSGPFDLFIAEFHHNISLTKVSYDVESVIEQVKKLVKGGKMAESFTVAIDVTMEFEQSEELQGLRADLEIRKWIESGRMNLVVVRSAQKFTMFGMDNYYGGIGYAVNNPKKFGQFNARMQQGNLSGLSYQGVAHLKIWGGDHQDRYRAALMKSTGDLYRQIPQRMVYRARLWNPIQISRIEDGHTLFLDIKAPGGPELLGVVYDGLTRLVKTEKLNLTDRASFGFHTTNLVSITSQGARLTAGLDRKTIDRIALYFQNVQKAIDQNRMVNDSNLAKLISSA